MPALRITLYTFLFALGLSVCAFGITFSPSYKSCVTDYARHYSSDDQQTIFSTIGTGVICGTSTLNDNTGAVTGLATVAVALFTLTLWLVTNNSVQLAREEFQASHRPRLVIREVRWDWNDSGSAIAYTLINNGDSECRVVESVLRYRSDIEETGSLDSEGINDIGPVTLKSGEYRFLTAPMISEGEQVVAAANELGFLSDHSFRGVIVYSDNAGIRRRMAFRRVCRRASGSQVSQRFEAPDNNEEYEYTD